MPDLLLNVADYARAARTKLAQNVCDYYDGGALDEITLRENTVCWERLKLYYHVLAGVKDRELGTTVLGKKISMPICVAPTAFRSPISPVRSVMCPQRDSASVRHVVPS